VYKRQHFPEHVLGERLDAGSTVFENDAVRFWNTSDYFGREIAILSFKSKMCVLGPDVVDGVIEAVARAEAITRPGDLAAEGAVLRGRQSQALAPAARRVISRPGKGRGTLPGMSQAVKYAQVPVVAAVNGMALGGGCELVMHCARNVAALESYIGLVEAGVGPDPGGRRLQGIRAARRQGRRAHHQQRSVPLPHRPVQTSPWPTCQECAGGEGNSASCANRTGSCSILMKRCTSRSRPPALAEAGYRPRLAPRAIKVAAAAASPPWS